MKDFEYVHLIHIEIRHFTLLPDAFSAVYDHIHTMIRMVVVTGQKMTEQLGLESTPNRVLSDSEIDERRGTHWHRLKIPEKAVGYQCPYVHKKSSRSRRYEPIQRLSFKK